MPDTASVMLPSSVELGEIVEQVWSSFLDGDIISAPGNTEDKTYSGQLVASVSITGDWAGHLMITAGRECSYLIASSMFEMDASDISQAEVADALGEIANMVGGSVKGMVGVSATLSLPQVILDAAALVNPDARKIVSVAAQWNGQPFEVSLWERSVDGPVSKGA